MVSGRSPVKISTFSTLSLRQFSDCDTLENLLYARYERREDAYARYARKSRRLSDQVRKVVFESGRPLHLSFASITELQTLVVERISGLTEY